MLKILICCLFTLNIGFASILVIGDSHTAGPFGKYLHKNLTTSFDQVTTFGHASSAPLHWVYDSKSMLSGGVYNEMYFNRQSFKNPHPTHWREKVQVPFIDSVLQNNAYHTEWRENIDYSLKSDLIVIALGANDARAISNADGEINTWEFEKRKKAITLLLDKVENENMKCLWIAPPDGIKKPAKNQAVLYDFIYSAVNSRCPIFSSLHYKAIGCDGIHFNCQSELKNAQSWAREVYEFILLNQ